MTFTILSVCTGNVCRSPIAALLLADELRGIADLTVESAGVSALIGHGVPDPMHRLAVAQRIDTSAHRARQLDVSQVRDADLILTMARDHRRHIVEMSPAAMRRTFTLRELARIAGDIEPRLPNAISDAAARTPTDAMRTAVSLSAALRGTVPPPPHPSEFDIVDPFGRSDEMYQRSFTELAPAAKRVSAFLLRAAALA